MNRIYKVIWSKVKNCYIVVSEIAKSHSKPVSKGSRQYVSAAAALAVLALLSVPAGVYAQDGVNTFVDPANKNIKMGNGISLRNNNGQNGTVAIGDHVQVDDYVMQQGSVAIGTNAFVENMWGGQERTFRFGMTENKDLMAGIAIGQNTYARSGIQIGDHKYIGRLGDTTVDPTTDSGKRNLAIVMGTTTLGHNSYSNGAFTTNTGAFSIMTNGYEAGNKMMVGQNFGAVINGSFNSIESKTSSSMYSGIANSVVGTVNRVNNSNGTLIFGAGNEVTNSVDSIKTPADIFGLAPSDAKDLADTLRSNIRGTDGNGTPGGAVLAIGGGNKADYATRSQLSGVGNTLTGTSSSRASYNMLNGYRNKGTTTSYATMIGTLNTITNGANNVIVGNKQKLTNASNNIILGTADSEIETTVSDAVAIGHNSKTTATGGVALGTGSVASTALGQRGYDPSTKANSTSSAIAWKSTAGAVSVGDASKNITRQITGVAAGTADTDAVNVAQLRAVTGGGSGGSSVHFFSVNGDDGQTNYNNDGATGSNAIAIGGQTSATSNGAIAIGHIAQATGNTSIALGFNALAGGSSTVIGESSMVNAPDDGQGAGTIIIGSESADVAGNKAAGASGDTIIGGSNGVKESNGVFVRGQGNFVDNAYKMEALTDEDMQALQNSFLNGTAAGSVYEKLGSHVSVNGDGNYVKNATFSQISGTNNQIIGSDTTSADYNIVTGNRNVVENATNNIVTGDNYKVTGANNNVILGSADTTKEVTVSDTVSVGHNASASVADGVALGSNSIASVDKGVAGYNPSTKALTGTAWTSTVGSVSVGDAANDITRQITGVAAGTADTDAVNVAQLKANKVDLKAGDKVTITSAVADDGATTYTIASTDTNTVLAKGEITYSDNGADGTLVLTDSDNNPVTVKGLKNTYVESAALDTDTHTLTLTRNDGKPIEVTGIATTADLAANKTHFYSVKSTDEKAGNYNNDGAKGANALAAGVGAVANTQNSIAIGNSAQILGNGGNSTGTSSIAIGDKAVVTTNGLDLTSIAIGKNAVVLNGSGKQDKALSFTPDNYASGGDLPIDADKSPGGIAIGTNAYARTASVQIGAHTMDGYVMGGTEITGTSQANLVGMTTIGTNSYNKGAMGSMLGAYSVMTGDFDSSGGFNSLMYGSQNFGANVVGSLNSVRSAGHSGASGVANSIVGVGNIAENANGALIYGAGNKITNSVQSITGIDTLTSNLTVDQMTDAIRQGIQRSGGGGSTLAVGGGNTADYTRNTAIIGVNNTVSGVRGNVSQYNFVSGYNNTSTGGDNTTIIGTNRTLTGVDNTIVIGSADSTIETTVNNAVAIGRNTNVTVDGGVALGQSSIADTDKGIVGYDMSGRITDADSILGNNTQYQTLQTEVADAQTTVNTLTSESAELQGYMDQIKSMYPSDYEQQEAYQGIKAQYDAKQSELADAQTNLSTKQSALAEAGKAVYTWQATAGAVSVGDVSKGITRQITDVAAGTEDTDAVNVAQLKAAKVEVVAGKNISSVDADTTEGYTKYTVNAVDTKVTGGSATYDATTGAGTITLTTTDETKPVTVTGLQDTYVTGVNLKDNTLTITQNAGKPFVVNNIATKDDVSGSATHYYSVNDGNYQTTNYDNTGAKGGMSLAAGAGSTANGTASTVTGAFSRVDGNGTNGMTSGFQGATAAAYGSFNVVGAKSGVEFDGVANSIIGVANKTENANAALIMGAGNKVTNSYRPVDMSTAAPLANALQKAIQTGDTDDMITALGGMVKTSGGAVLTIGGANTVDYALLSKVVGVGNTLTGTDGNESKLNMIDGFANTGTNINNVTVIGSGNTVADTNGSIVLGDNRKLTGASNSVFLGAADKEMATTVSDATAIGHNANVTVANGVALGSSSVASVDKGVVGYNPGTKVLTDDEKASATWTSTLSAVSVGDSANKLTRQITNVAAGTNDTDAVNVAQLKQVASAAEEAGKTTLQFAGDDKTAITRGNGQQLNITGGAASDNLTDGNIGVVKSGDDTLQVKLSKDLNALNSVRVGGSKAGEGIYIANQTVTYTKDGADGDTEKGNYITGLANTTWDPTNKGYVSGRAATEDQLNSVYETINQNITANKAVSGKNITVDKDNKVNLNDEITLGDAASNNVAISGTTGTITAGDGGSNQVAIDGTKSTITAGTGDNKVTVDGNTGLVTVGDTTKGAISIGNQTVTPKVVGADGTETDGTAKTGKYITGLENTTWDPTGEGYVADRAATEGQLKDIADKIGDIDTAVKSSSRVFESDSGADKQVTRKNTDAMKLKGGADANNLSDNNIGVVNNSDGSGFDIKLSKDIKGLNSIEVNNKITVGTGDKQTVIEGDTINTGSVTTGNTTVNNDGLTIKNEDSSKNITVQNNNISMGGNRIQNVGDATESTDAVNKGQFDRAINNIGTGMDQINNRVNKLDNRVNRVGAGAAALAALHPLEFSPEAKWEVTAGLGNYRGANAVAVGAFYRPNGDTMVSIGTSYGGGENMVNAGVTWRVGEGETTNYPSKQAMAQEIDSLKSVVSDQSGQLQAQNSKIEAQSQQLEEQNKKIEQLMQAIAELKK